MSEQLPQGDGLAAAQLLPSESAVGNRSIGKKHFLLLGFLWLPLWVLWRFIGFDFFAKPWKSKVEEETTRDLKKHKKKHKQKPRNKTLLSFAVGLLCWF